MQLGTIDGKQYMAHYHYFTRVEKDKHVKSAIPVEIKYISCLVHEGACPEKNRPCGAPANHYGESRCSQLDTFNAAEGRKLAFERAISEYSRELREKLWAAYFTIHSKPQTIANIKRENKELRRLFELQHTRVFEATKMWQEATGNTEVLPDLGRLIEWLMKRAEQKAA